MLVLTRKETQSIRIGDNIVITVVHTGSSSVKIGIEAPRDVRVVRGELETHTPANPIVRDIDPLAVREFAVACVGAA